jgi:nucleoside-diphosphate kinase
MITPSLRTLKSPAFLTDAQVGASGALRQKACTPSLTELPPVSMPTETTLILFKPDTVAKNITGKVLSRFQAEGFIVRGMKMMILSDEILAEHYSHIADKPFFPSVRGFMQETPVIALALEGENVIARVRDLLGPTDSIVAAAGTIRGDFGFKDADAKMRNVCHASDSVEAAQDELKRFFKDGEIFAY